MRALVTGGCGYFGSLLARRLRAEGLQVRVFDLSTDFPDPGDIELVQGDIRDEAAVDRACRGADLVFHNAAQVPLAKDRALFLEVNRDGTGTLLSRAKAAGARKVVHTSSSAVFGVPERCPVTEDTPPRPAEDYGAAKLAAEELCLRYAADGLDVTIIRPRPILGHGRLGIFHPVFEWVRRGCNVPVLGSGDNVCQFVHADDLASACLLASRRPGPTVYNCGAERFGTMRESLQALCDHAGTGSRVRSLPKAPAAALMRLSGALGLTPLAPYHALLYGEPFFFDLTRIKAELGYRATRSNAQMLIESYDRYLADRTAAPPSRGASAHRSGVRPGLLSLVGRLL